MNKLFMLMILGLGLMASNPANAQVTYSVNISGDYPCFGIPIITNGVGGSAQFLTNTSGTSSQTLTGVPGGFGPHGAGIFVAPCGGNVNHLWDNIGSVETWDITYSYCCDGKLYDIFIGVTNNYNQGTYEMNVTSTEVGTCEGEGDGCP